MDDQLTMGSVVRRSARQYPNRIAYYFGDQRVTFAEHGQNVNKAANFLLSLGLERGAHVAILGRNSLRYLEYCHGAAKAGLVFGTMNWRLAATEVNFIVTDGDNRVLLVEHDLQDVAAEAIKAGGMDDVTIVVYGGDPQIAGAVGYEELYDNLDTSEPGVVVDSDEHAVIMYTSGTTGFPKGAVLSHANIAWDAVSYLTYIAPQPTDCFLLSMPMNHVSGLHTQTTSFLIRGLPVVIMRQWDPEEACALIERHRITLAYILVAPLHQLMDSAAYERYDLTSLRRVMTAAAKYTPEFTAKVMARLEIDTIVFMYGLTETGPIVSTTEISAQMIDKPNTLGFPVWYVDVEIVDTESNPLPRGETGEIVVRGPNVFHGYYKRDDANREVFADGWLHTGDLGYLDDDNFLFFVDRKKDMIKSGGENVYSLEVELALLETSPEIADVAVIGVPDTKFGEAVIAYAVAKPGGTVDPEAVRSRARERLPGFKVPKQVRVIDEMPRNISGKILKRRLRDSHTGGRIDG